MPNFIILFKVAVYNAAALDGTNVTNISDLSFIFFNLLRNKSVGRYQILKGNAKSKAKEGKEKIK